MSKPILCLDFDGVIHSYTSGWKGARNIPDAPVPGALKFIVKARKHFTIAIYSSRSGHWFGRRAMKKWLYKHYCELASTYETTPGWLLPEIRAFADPWPDQVNWDMQRIVNELKWPSSKPPAFISIDDRALTFQGAWPTLNELQKFRPWNKR